MKTITTLVLLFISVACFAQVKPKAQLIKLDSIKCTEWEAEKAKTFQQQSEMAQRLRDKAQDLIDKAILIESDQAGFVNGIKSHSDKEGDVLGFRNGYMILRKKD